MPAQVKIMRSPLLLLAAASLIIVAFQMQVTIAQSESVTNTSSGAVIDGSNDIESQRVYGLKRCSGGGCPYTASWLADINLYRQLPWYMDSTKMEAASFTM